ncbi:MAG: DnaB-like helicase C-terminal domain-containing protein [Nocardioides sp.]
MDQKLTSLTTVVERSDSRLRSPQAAVQIWPTGFPILDDGIGGGFRAGALNVLAGPQGQGKSTMALQMCRNAAAAGCAAVMFSFELEAETLLQRLISMEAGLMFGTSAPPISQIREAFDGNGRDGGLPERLLEAAGPMAIDALMAIGQYSDRLVIHRSTSGHTDMAVIADNAKEVYADTGQAPLIVVDYLQKVKPFDRTMSEEQQITLITQQLKDLAIDFASPVLALSSADRDGLKPGQRMRARHLKGSTALAYEPDVVMIMNTKADIVNRDALVYDINGLERMREWTVVTLEKNRQGSSGLDIEFRKKFLQGRFDVDGAVVSERMVEERLDG